jgi:hypothetical protein
MEQISQDALLRAVVGLLLVNILVRVAADLSARSLRVGRLADWLVAEVLPWVLRAASVEVVLVVLPSEWAEVRSVARGAVCVGVCSALVRRLLETLREPV